MRQHLAFLAILLVAGCGDPNTSEPETALDASYPETPQADAGSGEPPATSPAVGLVFASDWRTSTGTSDDALLDTTRTPAWSSVRKGSNMDQLQVVSASGLGFPSTMSQVLRAAHRGTQSCDVRAAELWPAPAPGQSIYFRMYLRFSIPDSYGNLGSSSHHPIQPDSGTCPMEWEFTFGSKSDGTLEANYGFYTSGAGFSNHQDTSKLKKFETYRWEWAFHRQASGTYKTDIRVHDSTGALVLDDDDFISRFNPDYTTPLSTKDPDLTFSDHCIRRLFVGYNGPNWPDFNDDSFMYVGGVAVKLSNSANDWIGPYSPDEKAE